VFSDHDMVVVGVGEAPMLCLLGEGRSNPPSPSKAVWNSSVESPIMSHSGVYGLLWVEPMTVASEPSLLGERLRPPKLSTMDLRLPMQIVHQGRSHCPICIHHQQR
jgi:hypothetical protein